MKLRVAPWLLILSLDWGAIVERTIVPTEAACEEMGWEVAEQAGRDGTPEDVTWGCCRVGDVECDGDYLEDTR